MSSSISGYQRICCLVALAITLYQTMGEEMENKAHPDWLLAFPAAFEERRLPVMTYNPSLEKIYLEEIASNEANKDCNCHEAILAMNYLFYGQENGLVLEMGAAGGDNYTYANSYLFEDPFHWNRILIEANPVHFPNLAKQPTRKNGPTAFAVGAAVCHAEREVHYIYSDDKDRQYVSGIYEMMNIHFRRKFHRDIEDHRNMKGPPSKWKTLPSNMIRIQCARMSTILKKAGVTHINWLSLDTEGGELEVLRTIDWDTTTFDVLTVETEPWFRPSGYLEQVQSFLEERGYVLIARQYLRNSWFRHKTFKVSRSPRAQVGSRKQMYGPFNANLTNMD